MAAISINDLATSVTLERRAMASIRGGDGAPWVFAFQPFIASAARAPGAIINLFQTNTFYTAEQMTNQTLNIDIGASGSGSLISVAPTVVGITQK